MASIADLLGVQWNGANSVGSYRLSPHAAKQATMKGFHPNSVLEAAENPEHTSPNGRYEGQFRHVRNGIVAVVDPNRQEVVTTYKHNVETNLRADQTDRDAKRYERNRGSR